MSRGISAGAVLILDGDMSHGLAIVRSLARCGHEVDVAAHVAKSLVGRSRVVRRQFTYPDPLVDESGFLAWIQGVVKTGGYRLIIPVTERTTVPVGRDANLAATGLFAMAPLDALGVALDKQRTLDLAGELGIPVPAGRRLATESDLAACLNETRYPVVVKPGRSIGSGAGQLRQLSVDYAFGERELLEKARHFLRYGEVLLQEYVAGEGVGVELIACHGRVEYAFQHRRLHEVPLTGGGSSLRESVPVLPELLAASEKLMAALRWHGVAMVEFKRNPADGSFVLMEINGRFWGSLPLAVAAGADFPAMLCELMLEGRVHSRPPARTGVVCRKLSSDIRWTEQVMRRDAPARLVNFPSRGQVLRDWLLILSPRHCFDVQSWRDPWPGLVDLAAVFEGYLARINNWRRRGRALKAHRQAWRNGKAGGVHRVLFVCYGNINRSALAERCFAGLAPSSAVTAISAGFHEEEGRPADPVMVEVARQAGINLDGWSSHRVTADMVAGSEAIFVMEHRQFVRLREEFPEASARTFLLGVAAGTACPGGEIADPYGRPRSEYERCLKEVVAGVRGVGEWLGLGNGRGD